MQLWVLSSRQHLGEKLSRRTCIQTEGGIGANLSLSSVAYVIVNKMEFHCVARIRDAGRHKKKKIFAVRRKMCHGLPTKLTFVFAESKAPCCPAGEKPPEP